MTVLPFAPRSILLVALAASLALGRHALARSPAGAPATAAIRAVSVTFDDLPFVAYGLDLKGIQERTARLLDVLQARKIPAIGFVNEDKIQVGGERDARVALLEAWLEAGLDLGNHNYGHVGFQTTPLERYQEAVLKGEVVTRHLMAARGRAPRYYRHTFTQTGPTREAKAAFEAFLQEHGYSVAPFTIENADFVFARLYAEACRANDGATAARLRAAYLVHTATVVEFMEGESRDLFGREIPQVLLIHANELNADALADLLDRLGRRGYAFVSLDEALRDAAYRSEDAYVGGRGPSWRHRWRVARGQDPGESLRREPDPPQWVLDLFRAVAG